ncbi:MAG: GAF domain-containing protein [Ktedonobacteraceae bacterium]|nr:GAF domain-containing protein [Ktedonobacteraceae bacterium]
MTTRNVQAHLDLVNCDHEPIHIPGSIQSHGVLLVLKEPELTLLQVSENVQTMFGIPAQSVLNHHVSCLLEPSQVEILTRVLLSEDIQSANPIKLRAKAGKRKLYLDGIVHRIDGLLMLELEVAELKESASFVELYRHLKASLTRLQLSSDLHQLCQVAAEEIRLLTGFDRVMIYRFDEQWNGVVVAEDKKAHLHGFLGLQFPASDIPALARELYLKNWLRLINDAGYHPAAIVPVINPLTQRPVDLSYAVLRGVSPVHLEYLKNMEVRASMSISLLKGNTLWGLIACHHFTPKYIGHEMRSMCELVGQIVSMQLLNKQKIEEYRYGMQVKNLQTHVASLIMKEEDGMKGLKRYGRELLKLVNAQGLAICFDEGYDAVGQVPGEAELRPFIQWLWENMREDIFATSHLPGIYQEAREAKFKEYGSGVLAISISHIQRAFLLWFRPEVIQTVNWGGNPDEGVKEGKSLTDLHPRASYEIWKQTICLTSLPWQLCEIQAATELRSIIVDKALQDIVLKQTLGLWLRQ